MGAFLHPETAFNAAMGAVMGARRVELGGTILLISVASVGALLLRRAMPTQFPRPVAVSAERITVDLAAVLGGWYAGRRLTAGV